MATLEDILAASEVLDERSDGAEEKRNCDSDAKKDDDNSAADATKGVDERATVLDINNCLDEIEKEKAAAGNLSRLSTGKTSELDNRVDVNVSVDERTEDGKDSITDNGGNIGSDDNKLDITEGKYLYADVDGCENWQVNGEKLEALDHGFHVGDFVWGKIKSHPWWPGQIYDSKDASDFAMKRRQDGRLLVAFFGDGSWSWCLPSQLKPFVENFGEMSVGSSSKSFVNAVQSAIDDISRLLESKMSCRCVPLEKRDTIARMQVTNAGINAGVPAPDVDIHQLSVAEYEPTGLLARLTQFAKADFVDNVDNAFELAVLRSWLSAFYRDKGVRPLPIFSEPFNIEGMEDKNKTAAEVTNDFSVPIEVPLMGPLEDDWVSSPSHNGKSSQPGSGDKTYHRRKQKSVAEIMGELENLNEKSGSQEETAMKEGKDSRKSKSSKKKKSNDVEVDDGEGAQGVSAVTRLRGKRKVDISESPEITVKKVSSAEDKGEGDAVSEGTLSGKRKRKANATELPKIAAKNSSKTENKGGGGDVKAGTSGKPRSKTKVNGAPKIDGKNVSNTESRGGENDASEGSLSGKRNRKTKATESANIATEEVSNKESRGGGDDASNDTLSGKPKRKAKVSESSEGTLSGKRKTKAKATESLKKEVSITENKGARDDASEGALSVKRKRKAKAEAELPAKNVSETENRSRGNDDATAGTLTRKRKRKAKANELPNIATEEVSNKENKSGEEVENEGTLSGKPERKASVIESSDQATRKVSNKDNKGNGVGASEGTLSGKPKRKAKVTESPNVTTKKVSILQNGGGGDDASEVTLSGKPKRKAKLTESPNVATEKVSNAENGGNGDDAIERSLSGNPKKLQVVASGNTSGEALEDQEMSSPRERKKSKYLSPPYTNPTWRIGNSSFKLGTISDKILPKGDNVEEHRTEASANPSASTPVLKSVDKSSNETVTNSHQAVLNASGKESPRTTENSNKLPVAASDVNIPVDELVSDIQSAARNASYLSKEGCLDMVSSFVSALRSSVYVHGSNYKVYKKWQKGGKRKSIASQQQGNQENDLTHKKVKPDEKTMSEGKKTGKKPDSLKSKSKSKKAPEILDGNASSSALLVLKFTAEYPLPSKDEIVHLFSKFGSLNETETRVVTDSHSVQIVYTKDTDTEAAFKSAVSERPFGDGNVVNYSFQQSSGSSKSRSSHSKSVSRKRALEKPSSSQPKTDNLLSDVRVIRQKLDIMSAILENYHLKFTPEDKSGLRDEMKSLLENVETVSEKVRVLAENSPSA